MAESETLRRQAEAGDPVARTEIGSRTSTATGIGVERDEAASAENYRMAAEAGLALGQHNFAVMLQTGRGVEQDELAAVEWFSKAAKQGLPCAQFALATLWEKGFFDSTIGRVVRSDEEALKWYEHAANQGHPPSQKRFKALFATLNFAPGYEPVGGLAVEDMPEEGQSAYDIGAEGSPGGDY